ncbi:hypothetical protein JO41_07750 [Treponema sp. OMZ 838]|uniref:hypothetical protein n=1 Tax=Treponema sp. OMZ 838 TaxID=1539298 RepID=UPI0005300EE7|nr:hypothetical protein [Treponema sp. OMZ 838]AIW89696.1 hypothetical protein JO41_07750 [Treponema sp. OMZ 838]
MCEILFPQNATVEQNMNFGNCCIRARKAHTSIRKFSKENLTVKVSGIRAAAQRIITAMDGGVAKQ